MKLSTWRLATTTALLCALAGCGGGSDDPPYRPMMVNVAVITSAQPVEMKQGAPLNLTIDGSVQRIDIGPAPVFLNVRDANGIFAATTVSGPIGNNFTLSVPVAAGVMPGSYTGTLVVRACLDAACQTPYLGTTGSLPYALKVNPPG